MNNTVQSIDNECPSKVKLSFGRYKGFTFGVLHADGLAEHIIWYSQQTSQDPINAATIRAAKDYVKAARLA